MNIPSFSQYKSLQMMNLLQRMGGSKVTSKVTNALPDKTSMVEVVPGFFCQNDPKIIANFRKNFDKDGDFINSQGVAGMLITGKDPSEWKQTIDIREDGREKLFDMVKSEFIENNGILNGDTTRKSEVFAAYQKSIPKADRLKATWTMGNIEQDYREALIAAVKESNPDWEIGKKFDYSVLDNVTRESVENAAKEQSRRSLNISV